MKRLKTILIGLLAMLLVCGAGSVYRMATIGKSGDLLTSDFLLEVAKGNVPGHSHINKYGHNESVDTGPEDIWGGGGLYDFYFTSNQTVEAVSTDVDDVGELVVSGTATGGSLTTLIDGTADFVPDGVAVGDVVINDTTGEWATVNFVNSTTLITHTPMTSGSTVQTAIPMVRSHANKSGDTYRIASSADTGAGVIQVEGLTDSGGGIWIVATETVILNGQTDVAITMEFIRLYRSYVLHAGSSSTNEGTISVEVDATVNSGTNIITMDGQSQQANMTVPSGKTGYFIKGYVGLGSRANPQTAGSAVFTWRARANNGSTGVFSVKGQIETMTTAMQFWIYEYGISVGIPEKADIIIRCDSTTSDMGVVGAFDMMFVDN
jgi:hypothetical protein